MIYTIFLFYMGEIENILISHGQCEGRRQYVHTNGGREILYTHVYREGEIMYTHIYIVRSNVFLFVVDDERE